MRKSGYTQYNKSVEYASEVLVKTFQEVSRNFLLQRAPLFLNQINFEKSITPKNDLEFKFNSGKDIKK